MTKSSKNPVADRIKALRAELKKANLSAYWVPGTDPHQSEYVPDCWERRTYISGFDGSAGNVVVGERFAGLWTDGRYFLQADTQLKGSGVSLFKMAEPKVPTPAEHLAKVLKPGQALGTDPRLMSVSQARQFEVALKPHGIKLKFLDRNLIDRVWPDQPAIPAAAVDALSQKFTGRSSAAKLSGVRKAMALKGAEAHVVTTLDSIAWLFNLRGGDVDFNPVFVSYAIVTQKSALLMVDADKLTASAKKALSKVAEVRPYRDMGNALTELARAKTPVLIDPDSCNAWVATKLKGARLIEATSPIPKMKARKNDTELTGTRQAHVRDGAAVVKFLHWLSTEVPKGTVSEISAADKLEGFRRENEHFKGLSFRTISGYRDHGAIIHYSVTPQTDVPLAAEGIYLVDSGGQYLDGTTDITRTVLLGKEATAEQKDRFTRVLKGHINLGQTKFPQGVNGIRLDTLARASLWSAGLDYGHGTGHGVGSFLNVHEGPPSISVRGAAALQAGNILSNEPGYYEPGQYGIRIENLVIVKEGSEGPRERPFLEFETITLAPIDHRLIEVGLLTDAERGWLNDYHRRVYKTLSPLVGGATKKWLKQETAPL